MGSDADFGNAEFEPSDEQLQTLSREAFADVAVRNKEALARIRAQVADLRGKVLASLQQRHDKAGTRR